MAMSAHQSDTFSNSGRGPGPSGRDRELKGGSRDSGRQPSDGDAGCSDRGLSNGWDFLASRPSGTAHVYTRLTQNIASIARGLDPSPKELQRRQQVLEAVSRAVNDSFPEYRGIAKVGGTLSLSDGMGWSQQQVPHRYGTVILIPLRVFMICFIPSGQALRVLCLWSGHKGLRY